MRSHTSSEAAIHSIWIVSREYEGLAGAGGVKDVTRQMAETMTAMGLDVNVVLPRYGFIQPDMLGFDRMELSFDVDMPYASQYRREAMAAWRRKIGRKGAIFLLESPRFAEKMDVYTYTGMEEAAEPDKRQGQGHIDYFAMNILLQKGTLGLIMNLRAFPDIIHCHDGHAALIPAMVAELEGYRHYFRKAACMVTIHNAGRGYHQEVGDLPFAQAITGLPRKVIMDNLLNGAFDPLLAASPYAVMNTVSENYARELRETYLDEMADWLGHRLLAREVRLEGITNGIDPEAFDTTRPERLGLAAGYSIEKGELSGKTACRRFLRKSIALRSVPNARQEGMLEPEKDLPLFVFIGRFTYQKGVTILTRALQEMAREDQGFHALILGNGPKDIEDGFTRLALDSDNQGRICVLIGYDSALANNVYAAADFFLAPSLFEPCGLTDYIAQLFGAVPIVHHIGGLVKVIDGKTGLAFHEATADALQGAMRRALRLYREHPEEILKMRKAAVANIKENYTWKKVVNRYLDFYRQALRAKGIGKDFSKAGQSPPERESHGEEPLIATKMQRLN